MKMDFINRGFSGILFAALIILSIAFLINILPIALLIGLGAWGINYMIKAIKGWKLKRGKIFKRKSSGFEQVDIMQEDFSEEFNIENAIDIEYTEIK